MINKKQQLFACQNKQARLGRCRVDSSPGQLGFASQVAVDLPALRWQTAAAEGEEGMFAQRRRIDLVGELEPRCHAALGLMTLVQSEIHMV